MVVSVSKLRDFKLRVLELRDFKPTELYYRPAPQFCGHWRSGAELIAFSLV